MAAYSIAVFGLWHLGEVYSTGLAELGYTVVGIADDEELIRNFSQDIPPLPEPGVAELLAKHRASGRLRYTTDIAAIRDCNVLWFTFDTPVDENDDVDLGVIYRALDAAVPHLKDGVLIVATSQRPVGTSKAIKARIAAAQPGLKFGYVYTPENLRLGEAVRCFSEPGRIIVGAETPEELATITEIFAPLKTEILAMAPASAEMAKHAVNAFLATSLSFINDIADVCEVVGANVLDVARALRSEPRIGPKAYLDAGLGFSGGTLGRDLKVLIKLAHDNSIEPSVAETVFMKNNVRKDVIERHLAEALGGLTGKTVAVFGLTYKAGTRTLRRSRALEVAGDVSRAGASLRLHDPAVVPAELPAISGAAFFADPYEAAHGADAILLMTPWPEFRSLDFAKLGSAARPGALFFDTSNFLAANESAIRGAGFRYRGVGRGS